MGTLSQLRFFLLVLLPLAPMPGLASDVPAKVTVAVIGTGDMGDSLGPRLAELGYTVVYGSRNPASDRSQQLLARTGHKARITTQRDAAQAGDIVVLAIPWPAMITVAQSLGSLDGKIVT